MERQGYELAAAAHEACAGGGGADAAQRRAVALIRAAPACVSREHAASLGRAVRALCAEGGEDGEAFRAALLKIGAKAAAALPATSPPAARVALVRWVAYAAAGDGADVSAAIATHMAMLGQMWRAEGDCKYVLRVALAPICAQNSDRAR